MIRSSGLIRVFTVGSDQPLFDYLPLDEKHPCRPEAAYDLSKQYVRPRRLQCQALMI